ncbi:dihydropteroate synthase [Oceanobacter kriegii]|uniref:dihydropteroate synthase n=1 Tax=Oceanobacter kriegii TaxID=64972 RepID=UPI000400FC1E|nr:dihydropteroate synthase [Oceanobacter kriegii]
MILQCGSRQLSLARPVVMGILNATPDSFSDGGRFNSLDVALKHAEAMLMAGAGIIDVGGESTRPGADPVTVAEELERVVPVVEGIAKRLDVAISVDTSTPEVITESAAVGAHIINDVRALEREGAVAATAATGLPVCLMHMKGQPENMQDAPQYASVVDEVMGYLQQRIEVCEAGGIARDRILIDPGFGFGKTAQHNYELLNRLAEFESMNLPLLTGLSRKRMIGDATGVDVPDQRTAGSVAAAVICAMKGARIIRVHDVKETVDAMAVVSATLAL